MSLLSLKAFFTEDESRPIADLLSDDAPADLLKSVAGLPPALLPGAAKAVSGALDGLFDISLGSVLQASWQSIAAVKDALKTTRDDAEAKVLVPLLDHKITSSHKPHIDLVVGGKSLGGLVFEIALTLQLKGVQLEVAKGRFAGLGAGAVLGQGVFSFAGQPLIQRTSPAFNLPGRVAFKAPEAEAEAGAAEA